MQVTSYGHFFHPSIEELLFSANVICMSFRQTFFYLSSSDRVVEEVLLWYMGDECRFKLLKIYSRSEFQHMICKLSHMCFSCKRFHSYFFAFHLYSFLILGINKNLFWCKTTKQVFYESLLEQEQWAKTTNSMKPFWIINKQEMRFGAIKTFRFLTKFRVKG